MSNIKHFNFFCHTIYYEFVKCAMLVIIVAIKGKGMADVVQLVIFVILTFHALRNVVLEAK